MPASEQAIRNNMPPAEKLDALVEGIALCCETRQLHTSIVLLRTATLPLHRLRRPQWVLLFIRLNKLHRIVQ